MKLSDTSIKLPVFTTMIIMSLVVLGLFSYNKLNVDQFPNVDMPFVVVTAVLPGAGPEQIENDVTEKIEDAVNPIEGVDKLTSVSQEGVGTVIIQFKLEIDGKKAAQDVREKVAAIRNDMPSDLKDPVIQRFDPATQPILMLTVSGDKSLKELTAYTKDVVQKRLENIPGVGNVELLGGYEREIEINLNPVRLKAYNLTVEDITQAISSANVEIPGGNLNKNSRQLLVRTMGKFKNVEDFKRIVIKAPEGRPIYLADLAEIKDGIKELTSMTRVNGETAIGLNIKKQSGSNTVKVADEVIKKLAVLKKEVPAGIDVRLVSDNSITIRASIHDVLFDIFYGGLLAVIVIYLFLANFRATIISALALPTSIVASFFVMYLFGFTLNMMTLLGLSLAVGLLIDDAIVVIENIYRHMAMGKSPMQAAGEATGEIGLAVLATTMTIVAVFVPVAFMPGIVGKFFYEFGITVSAAVLVSLLVAFTLTPMLSSRWLSAHDEELSPKGNPLNFLLYHFNHNFNKLNNVYRKMIRVCLSYRKSVIVASILIFLSSFYLMKFLGSEFFPSSDEGKFTVSITADPGSSLEKTSAICNQVEAKLRSYPEVETVITTVGGVNSPATSGTITVRLINKSKRPDKSVNDMLSDVRKDCKSIAGAKIFTMISGGPGGGEKPVVFSLRGDDLAELQIIANKVEDIIKSVEGTRDVNKSYEASKPEIRIELNRDKAADLGYNPYSVASTVRSLVDGYVATKFQDTKEQVDVRVKLDRSYRQTLGDIQDLSIRSNKKIGDDFIQTPLRDIANIYEGSGPTKINRYARQKEIKVDANLEGRTLGEAVKDIQAEIKKIELKPGYSINLSGRGESQNDSFKDILMSLMMAIVFVYIVLAMQFESFIHPFSIMLALPMAIIGAVLGLLFWGSALSVMSMIGIIMLMGIVTKNGILLVDYTNTLRKQGKKMQEALQEAGATRLRPILMTSFAMIFGMIPVAFGFGEGSEFRAPMGQAVIGGLITSTFLTLFVVPVVYSIFEDYLTKNGKLYRVLSRLLKKSGE